ncbi:MAG: M14 family metallocarboxypeptidase [Burkholderiales bacterium]|nr:M14 family metallocarboxypeptidase [Burkholderiales bacterium]
MQSWNLKSFTRQWPLGLAVTTLWACSAAPMPAWVPLPTSSRPAVMAAASAPAEASAAPVVPAAQVAASAAASAGAASAPAPMVESPGVAARFPDPLVSYNTPAFEPGHAGFTSNAELRTLMHGLVRDGQGAANATTVRLLQVGSSQTGIPLEALQFSREPVPLASTGATASPARPTVLLVGEQHGDEPAGGEALIVVAQELAQGALAPLLDRINVVILPRANPDGAAADRRLTASGIDENRDHLLLRTPEAQAQAQLEREFKPVVVVDAHEYSAFGPYPAKFDALPRFDALVQYAMVANLPGFVTKASEEWFRQPMLQSLKAHGLSTEWYYTTSADPADKKVSMGGVQPDTMRNVTGLRNAVSFLIESRGVGLGRTHLLRRVYTQVTAITSVLKSAAARADDMQKLRGYVDAEVAAKACRGEMIVAAQPTPSEYNLRMLDPLTGADKTVTVAWDSALELHSLKVRARPCGYWLGADQTDAVLRLRALGLQVQRLDEAGELRGETYTVTARDFGERNDVRGSIADAGGVVHVKVERVAALIDARAGSYYVGLDQPLANLAIAALEPDTQSSYVTHRIVTDVARQARVLMQPALKMTPME